jgi:hypothetical protein
MWLHAKFNFVTSDDNKFEYLGKIKNNIKKNLKTLVLGYLALFNIAV